MLIQNLTDVVVLAVMVSATLPGKNKIRVAFGTGRCLADHLIAASLGTEKSLALSMVVIPCQDLLDMLLGHSFPDLTAALLELVHGPAEISEQYMHVIERFFILMSMTGQALVLITKPGRSYLLRQLELREFHQHMLPWSNM